MADSYENVFFCLSTSSGLIEVGWRLGNKNRNSNIVCLVCAEQRQFHATETKREFVDHLMKEHPEMGFFLRLRNFHKIII